jgi:hypothetical protein
MAIFLLGHEPKAGWYVISYVMFVKTAQHVFVQLLIDASARGDKFLISTPLHQKMLIIMLPITFSILQGGFVSES